MAETSTCTARHCKTLTPAIVERCPACGNRVVTSRRIRILGWVLIGLGGFLVLFMGYIANAMYPTLSRPGVDLGAGGRWTGTAEQAAAVLQIFWLVIGFGALCVVNGIWQVATGRRNLALMAVGLLAAGALVFQTWETTDALKKSEEAEEARRFAPPMTPLNSAAPDKPQ
jgi:hypothetical protein